MTKPIIALTDFNHILPALSMSQCEALDHTVRAHEKYELQISTDQIHKLFHRYGVKESCIARRCFESVELGADKADIHQRALFFSRRAQDIFNEFYPNKNENPDHIIHVTCTGYVSPSAPQLLVNSKKWNDKTKVTHAYHMGCYASLPSVRMAEGFVAATQNKVDIIHTEMCSLHLNAEDLHPEQIIVQSLFADGHIKYSTVPAILAKSGFHVLNIAEKIIEDSHMDMSWVPAPQGMIMTLSANVPKKISSSLREFVKKLIAEADLNFADTIKKAHFAIHPGGPKIIDGVQEVLELQNHQVQTSRDVLHDRGNMSSATLPHVWEKMLQNEIRSDETVVSLVFGPGLTVFGSVFKVV